ncbi:phage holin family protein [Paenibacillus sp. NPDC058071]|uniref:phage holin family protein n=1 Tax=Paenibacillus sp. NPDC058071 TaxID=3346326 RepID=UPI0036DC5C69
MDWEVIIHLVDPELFIVLAACWVSGYAFKQTPLVADWLIVYLVAIIGIVFVCLLRGFMPESILQGVLCGAVAVYANQLIKQTVEKRRS